MPDDEFTPVEYKVELLSDLVSNKGMEVHGSCHNLETALNDFGKQGWELVVWSNSLVVFKRS